MASRPSTVQVNPQNCDYCHQKPKFVGHKYCSKTCGAQAAALCNHCQKKPKYQNFDFCGKNCAALAGSKTSPAIAVQSKPVSPPASNGSAAPQKSAALDAVQIAKLIVQQIPQFQAALQPNNTVSNVPSVPAPPSNNPFAVNVPKSGNTFNISTSVPSVPTAPNLPVSVDPVDCAIPGCGQPVHVDGAGSKISEYCSMRHREEAVASGLVSPCIMCLVLPQCETDYFCGRECRQDALNKQNSLPT